jgi:hypothetical protein
LQKSAELRATSQLKQPNPVGCFGAFTGLSGYRLTMTPAAKAWVSDLMRDVCRRNPTLQGWCMQDNFTASPKKRAPVKAPFSVINCHSGLELGFNT